MNKGKTKLWLGVTGLVIGIAGTFMFPLKANALGGIGGTSPSILDNVAGYNGNVKQFNSHAPAQYRSWYGSNKLFKISYGECMWYSPIPPRQYKNLSTLRSYSKDYENSHTYGTAFRTFATPLNDASHNNRVPVHVYNETSPYKGQSGEWRYGGYSGMGDVVSNPYFPSDVPNSATLGAYPWDNPWSKNSQYVNKSTVWDDPLNHDGYAKKRDALAKLLIQEPTMKAKSNNVDYWASRLSLRTDPTDISGIFMGTRANGTYYRAVTLKKTAKNLRIVEFTVRDRNGKLMGTFTRGSDNSDIGKAYTYGKLEAGVSYSVTVKVKNTSNMDTVLDPAKVGYGYTTGEKAWSNVEDYSDNEWHSGLTSSPIIKAKETREFPVGYITVPEDTEQYIRIHGLIDKQHYLVEDNMNPYDDNASIVFSVEGSNTGNDLFAKKVILIDRNGNETNKIIPGEDYKIKYVARYNGRDIWKCVSFPDGGGYCYQPKYRIPINGTFSRTLPGGGVETQVVSHTWGPTTLNKGDEFVYITPDYQTLEVPVIETDVRIDPSTRNKGFNWNLNNDRWKKTWKDFYDISVENVRVVPRTERPVKAGELSYGVIYDVNLEAPGHASNYEKDVAIAVTIEGRTYTFVDHLKVGENNNITKELTVPINPATDTEVNATVYANYDKYVWENDLYTQDNNKMSTKAQVVPPPNPFNGACQLGGVDTNNSWTQTYNIHKWNGYVKSYSANGHRYSFYQYSPVNTYDKKVSQNENYKINKVMFRSKLTEDLKLGASKDGWVDIAKGEAGKIKAGYGYELKVEVEYNTNAFTTEPSPWVTGGQGQWVRPQNVTPNLPDEIYVKTHDGKILSVSGIYGTKPGLVVSKTGDKNKTIWTYSIKPKDTLGIKETPKIYIDQNTKDGKYNLQIFTPEINGIPTKPLEDTLCDSKNLKIEVIGSDIDDLNSHIVQ